jgi:hypothetical protein
VSLKDVIKLAKQLSSVDKLRLIQEITPDLERELMYTSPIPRKSLWGLCADLGKAPSTEEIDQSRSEEWINFPR